MRPRWAHGWALALLAGVSSVAAAPGPDDARTCEDDGDIDACTRAIGSGRLSAADLASAFYHRGNAWLEKREYDRAIADYSEAIRLDPLYVVSYRNRAALWRLKGEDRKSIADYDAIIRLDLRGAAGYGLRGYAFFYVGRFAEAEADLRQAAELAPASTDYALWLYLAMGRQGKQEARPELEARAGRLAPTALAGAVLRHFLGRAGGVEVYAQARAGDERSRQEALCRASFYLGQQALLRGDRTAAARLFQEAVATQLYDLVEYAGADAELRRLGGR